MSTSLADSKIIFFDGDCVLCNKSIDFIVQRNDPRIFLLAPLKGKSASEIIPDTFQQEDSIVYFRKGSIHTLSTAVLFIAWDMRGIWKCFGLFLIIPAFLRNPIYRWIAKNRYHWFGKLEQCRVPSIAERSMFLD